MLERKALSHKFLPSKHKLKPLDPMRRTIKNTSKCSEAYRKIPKVIQDLQKNLSLLKKYYEEEENYQLNHQKQTNSSSKHRLNRPKSSVLKKAKKILEEETTIVPELEDVKKSFMTVNGYDSNNVVELYNFYKKNMEKSTRIFGSISGVNSTHNYSDCRENRRPVSALIVDAYPQPQDIKNRINQNNSQLKQKDQIGISLLKGNSELVNVANLLADRKKISRQNICNNINSDNLYNQAKRKLVRPNTMENIQRMNNNQENKRHQNVRISPARKIAKQKKSDKKQVQAIQKTSSVKKSCQKPSQKVTPAQVQNKVETEVKLFSPMIKEWSGGKASSRQKQQKEGRSGKSIKSGKTMRSPSLNKGLLFEVGQFSPVPKQQFVGGFKKSKTNELTDSLLDCEISLKENSRQIDLESVPFQF